MTVSKGKEFYNRFGTYIILVALVVFFSVSAGGFFTIGNLTNLLRTGAVYILFGCGMTFVMISGKIDLSVPSVAALVGCVAALLIKNGMGTMPAAIIAIFVGVAS